MAQLERVVSFTYTDLAKLTGMSIDNVRHHAHRKNFHPENLESVLIWLARHAHLELRQRMLSYAMSRNLLTELPGERATPKPTREQVLKRSAAKK